MALFINIFIALLGILLYTFYNAKNFMAKPDWSWQKFMSDNLGQTVWSALISVLIIVILWLVPESAEAIKSLTGLDLTVQEDGTINRVAYLTMGFLLSVTIRTGGK